MAIQYVLGIDVAPVRSGRDRRYSRKNEEG